MKKLFINNLSIFAILLIVFVFFAPYLVQGKIPISSDAIVGLYHPWRDTEIDGFNREKYPVKNPLITDPVLQTYPWRKIVIENIKNFRLPLWNPYSFSGQPLMANIQSAAFQPLNILFFFLSFKIAWTLQIILSATFAAIFTYLFLRSINLSKLASFFGAIIVPFSSFFTSWMTWGTINIAASLLPLALLCINKLSTKITAHYFLILTGLVSCAIFSGHLQTAAYVIFTILLYVIFISTTGKNLKLMILSTLAVLIGITIASIQILPTLEFANYSNRSQDKAYSPEKEDWFLPPKHLVQLISPDYFGNPTKGNYWGVWNYGEFTQFIGLVPLIFAIYALTKKDKRIIFFKIMLVLALIFALKNPISELPYKMNLPLISSSQPSRILYLLTFSLAILAAIGLDTYIKSKDKKSVILSSSIVAVAYSVLLITTLLAKELFPKPEGINTQIIALRNMVIPGLVGFASLLILIAGNIKNYRKFAVFVLVFVSIIELFYFSNKFTPFSSMNSVFPSTQITNYLKDQQKPFRVLSTDRRIANPNLLSAYNIESVGGYDPLYLKKYAIFVTAWQSNKSNNDTISFNRFITPNDFRSQIANLMNIKYVLTFDDINDVRFEKIMNEGSTKLYRNKNVQDRAFFVSQVIKKADDNAVLESLVTSPSFVKEAYSTTFDFIGGDADAKATISKYNDQSISISTSSKSPTPLIISNINFPGWKCYIDKVEVKIENVNYLLQSVVVPAGEHTVTLSFEPKVFKQSILLSLIGIGASLLIAFYIWRKSQ